MMVPFDVLHWAGSTFHCVAAALISIDRAIAALPEQQRLAVVLRTFEGLDYEEIAAALDTSVSSVKSLLFRARATLREALADEL